MIRIIFFLLFGLSLGLNIVQIIHYYDDKSLTVTECTVQSDCQVHDLISGDDVVKEG